jgi:hypothetical protein
MLALLPTEIVGEIAWLTPRGVRNLVLTSQRLLQSPFHDVYVRHHFCLRFPPDAQLCVPLVDACKFAVASSRSLPVRAVLGLPSQLNILRTIGIHDQIEKIEIDARRVPKHPLPETDRTWEDFAEPPCFQQLAHLTVRSSGGPSGLALDIEILARAAPMLEIFSVAYAALEHEDAFTGLEFLRRLEFRAVTFNSWRFASGLVRLDHFPCESNNVENATDFATWRPLKVLDVKRCPLQLDRFARAVEQTHLPVLEKLRLICPSPIVNVRLDLTSRPSPNLRELAIPPSRLLHGIGVLASMTQLRSLHLWWDNEYDTYGFNNMGIDDVTPLTSLVQLETLKVRLSNRATTCRPLRTLVRLRELHLVDGWLRDFVDCLPQLEKLSVEEFGARPRKRTFLERDNHRESVFSCCPRLSGVFIGKYVVLNGFAMSLIRNAQSLKFDRHKVVWDDVFRINELTKLTLLNVRLQSFCDRPSLWEGETQTLASIRNLHTLHLYFCHPRLMKLPWSLDGAIHLRVISLFNFNQAVLETIAACNHTVVGLEEIHLERYDGRSLAPLLKLHNLRVVGLDRCMGCRRLRSAWDVDGALKTIFHNGRDCAWHGSCPFVDSSYRPVT